MRILHGVYTMTVATPIRSTLTPIRSTLETSVSTSLYRSRPSSSTLRPVLLSFSPPAASSHATPLRPLPRPYTHACTHQNNDARHVVAADARRPSRVVRQAGIHHLLAHLRQGHLPHSRTHKIHTLLWLCTQRHDKTQARTRAPTHRRELRPVFFNCQF